MGAKDFVMETKAKLGVKVMGRGALENNEGHEFREFRSPYNHVFAPEKGYLRLKNDHFGQIFG